MHLSLAVSLTRCRAGDEAVASLALRGQLEEAADLGLQRLSRDAGKGDAMQRSLLCQMVSRLLLALGREQQAQELMQDSLKAYEELSRNWLRWLASLDQGWTFLCMNRPGRAIECFKALVDDAQAPPEVAIEALSCTACALHALGECQRAAHLIEQAIERGGPADLAELIECQQWELVVLRLARRSEGLADHALAIGFRDRMEAAPEPGEARRALAALEARQPVGSLVAHRLQHLQLMMTQLAGAQGTAPFAECLAWLRERRLAGLEVGARIESALVLLAGGSAKAAGDVLQALAPDDAQGRRHRYTVDLQYCQSKLFLLQGQLNDAMQAYKRHVEEAVFMIKRDFAQATRIADRAANADSADAPRLRLPLKYRGAYQYIVDHLSDHQLSIKHVAAHVGVTERSLQMAFRASLGVTPAEFIRRRRMERIRDELQTTGSQGHKVSVHDVAARWGVSNRSTLVQNYRQVFAETPFETLHGRIRGDGAK
ncbi:helix-turn-helix domain-containing protein [Ideonella sp. DXS29W]|uniref:Helix-turn-helix domain-containing protein n=1 Tax=Ideonella lacteola TaxID=2984193 RepID=A0ABU9BIM7_9BURK